MKTNDFNELMESVKEAGKIMAGKVSPSRRTVVSPMDIKRIRSSLNVSQNLFAEMIGVSVDTLQNWEQGRRAPKGPARALLLVAEKNPGAVLAALH